MLQISQTENPMCSATIDQMRLRRAMTLPLDSQNFSSSGFQSEIQAGSLELIRNSFAQRLCANVAGSLSAGMGARSGEGPVAVPMRMVDLDARLRSAQAIQASCQGGVREKICSCNTLQREPDRMSAKWRRQSLRFAHLLCRAQKISS